MNAGVSDRNIADRLLRLLVRQRRFCARCTAPGSQVAHLIPRRFAATRCDERAVAWLCSTCHDIIDGRVPGRWKDGRSPAAQFIESVMRQELHAELRRIAYEGPQGPLSAFWESEVERLRKRMAEEGL